MAFVQYVEKITRVVRLILELFTVVLFSTMTLLVFAQVCVRFLSDSSLTWSEELARYNLVWLIYVASIVTYGDKGHIIVDALLIALKGRLKLALILISHIFVLLFVVIVLQGAMELMPTTALQSSPANNIVMSNVYIVIPVSMIFMGLIVLKDICVGIMDLKNPPAEEAKP